MKDIPYTETDCFILYSSATGVQDSKLKAGVSPGKVRAEASIKCRTQFESITGSFEKNGLKIVPRLSDNRVLWDFTITECDMTICDYVTVTVKTRGDGDYYEPGEATFSLKIMCYGQDRPFLGNFIEYNCARDVSIPQRSLLPLSVNEIANVGWGELNIKGSALSLHNYTDDEGRRHIYYEGAPGDPGLYGIEIFAQTYEGGANVPGHVPNPFPPGQSAEVLMLNCYKDYYKVKDRCITVPQNIKLINGQTDMTAPYCTLYSMYGGGVKEHGGVFTPVFSGNAFSHYLRHIIHKPNMQSDYHLLFRIARKDDKWLLEHRAYHDEDDDKTPWETLATTPLVTLNVPVLQDGKNKTIRCTLSVPTFSKWADAYIDGDGAYYVQKRGYFHSAHLIPDDSTLSPIPVWVGASDEILCCKQTLKNGAVAFPEVKGWQIIKNGNAIENNVAPETPSVTVIPYAPPRKKDSAMLLDTAGGIPHALRAVKSGLCITDGANAGGIWKHYPWQRLVPWDIGKTILYSVSGTANVKDVLDITSTTFGCSRGEYLDDYNMWTGKTIIEDNSGQKLEQETHFNDSVEFTFSGQSKMDAALIEQDALRSLCTLGKSEDAKLVYFEENSTINDDNYYYQKTTSYNWENADDDIKINGVTLKASAGKQILVESVSEGEKRIFQQVTEEHADGGETTGEGVFDAYLHYGQCDTGDGRAIAQSGSYVGYFRASKETPRTKKVTTTDNNGTTTRTESGTIQRSLSATITDAEPYPRIALVNEVGELDEPERKLPEFDRDIEIDVENEATAVITGKNWAWDFNNVYQGDSSVKVNDAFWHTYPCYCTVGTSSSTTTVKLQKNRVAGYFRYYRSGNKASCSCNSSGGFNYKDVITKSLTVTAKHRDGDYTNPWTTEDTRETSVNREHVRSPAHSLEISFSHVDEHGEDIYKVTTKEGGEGKFTEEIEKGVPKVYELIPMGDAKETISFEKLTPKDVLERFEQFVERNSAKFEEFSGAEFDWYTSEGGFTDSPLYAVSEGKNINSASRRTRERSERIDKKFTRIKE